MAYHESFWVTVGAAAPVIALATVISATDAFVVSAAFRNPGRLPEKAAWRRDLRRGATLSQAGVYLAMILVFSQAAALGVALGSLASGDNLISPLIPALVEPVTLIALIYSGLINSSMRALKLNLEKQAGRGQERGDGESSAGPS